ncbi:MAG TPA: hypothetical protein VFS55_04005 [Dokdonella sp.]|nr:hypothetical protein [Dokdonella sp.]
MSAWGRQRWVFVLVLAGAVAGAGAAGAQTLEQDEARIEELMAAGPAQAPAATSAPAPAYDDSVNETPVVAAVVAPRPSANDEWLAAPSQDSNAIPFDELRYHVGERVAITTANEREHNGIVTSADARQVTVEIRRKGGVATYVLKKEQILHIESR